MRLPLCVSCALWMIFDLRLNSSTTNTHTCCASKQLLDALPSLLAVRHTLTLTLNSNVCRLFSHEGLTESKTTSVVYGPCRPTFSWQYGFVSPRKPSLFRFCRREKDGETKADRGLRHLAAQ